MGFIALQARFLFETSFPFHGVRVIVCSSTCLWAITSMCGGVKIYRTSSSVERAHTFCLFFLSWCFHCVCGCVCVISLPMLMLFLWLSALLLHFVGPQIFFCMVSHPVCSRRYLVSCTLSVLLSCVDNLRRPSVHSDGRFSLFQGESVCGGVFPSLQRSLLPAGHLPLFVCTTANRLS